MIVCTERMMNITLMDDNLTVKSLSTIQLNEQDYTAGCWDWSQWGGADEDCCTDWYSSRKTFFNAPRNNAKLPSASETLPDPNKVHWILFSFNWLHQLTWKKKIVGSIWNSFKSVEWTTWNGLNTIQNDWTLVVFIASEPVAGLPWMPLQSARFI